jgi:hypothetical protein
LHLAYIKIIQKSPKKERGKKGKGGELQDYPVDWLVFKCAVHSSSEDPNTHIISYFLLLVP